jgi:hypothetical protein
MEPITVVFTWPKIFFLGVIVIIIAVLFLRMHAKKVELARKLYFQKERSLKDNKRIMQIILKDVFKSVKFAIKLTTTSNNIHPTTFMISCASIIKDLEKCSIMTAERIRISLTNLKSVIEVDIETNTTIPEDLKDFLGDVHSIFNDVMLIPLEGYSSDYALHETVERIMLYRLPSLKLKLAGMEKSTEEVTNGK